MAKRESLIKLMLVDGEVDSALSIKLGLESSRYYVDVYNDPLEALLSFRPRYYQLALIDIRMPRLNGLRLYTELKKIDPQIRVCFMTAFEAYYQSLKEAFPSLDVRCYIKKPVSLKKLLETISKELKN